MFPAFSLLDNVWVAAFATAVVEGNVYKKATAYPKPPSARTPGAFGRRASNQIRIRPRAKSPTASSASSLAIALAAAPRVLLLDEPAAGLSPEETRNMVALVRALKGRYTIVLIEHKIDIIMSVSDRISVMHFGSLIAEGTPEEIQRNPEVRRAYLGGIAA